MSLTWTFVELLCIDFFEIFIIVIVVRTIK